MTHSNTDTFDVYLFTKVPYVTRLLEVMLLALFIFIVVTTYPLGYAENSPDETQVLYFMTLYPETLRKIIVASGILFVAIIPFYITLKLKRKATITLLQDKIEVMSKNYNKTFPIKSVRVVFCFDPHTRSGFPKEKFTIAIYTGYEKTTRVQLKNYAKAEKVMDILASYKDLKIEVFADKYLSVTDEE